MRHIFKGIVGVLALGERVAFFPEGTVAHQGQVLPFHANLFEAAIDAGVAGTAPAQLSYLDETGTWHPNVDYVGEITFVDSIFTILRGGPIRARLQPLARSIVGAHRRELAQRRMTRWRRHSAVRVRPG